MDPINYTGLAYATPSIWEGFARVLDIGATFSDPDEVDLDPESDMIALATDWYAVGADLWRSIDQYKTRVDLANTHDE